MLTMSGKISVKDPNTGAIIASKLDYLEARRARRDHDGPAILVDEDGVEVGIGGRPETGKRKGYSVKAFPAEWHTIDRAANAARQPTMTWLREALVAAAIEIKRLSGFTEDDEVPADRRLPPGKGISRTRGEKRVARIMRAFPDEWRQFEEAAALLGKKPGTWLRDVALAEAARRLGE